MPIKTAVLHDIGRRVERIVAARRKLLEQPVGDAQQQAIGDVLPGRTPGLRQGAPHHEGGEAEDDDRQQAEPHPAAAQRIVEIEDPVPDKVSVVSSIARARS